MKKCSLVPLAVCWTVVLSALAGSLSADPPAPTKQEVLLTEIRDILAKRPA